LTARLAPRRSSQPFPRGVHTCVLNAPGHRASIYQTGFRMPSRFVADAAERQGQMDESDALELAARQDADPDADLDADGAPDPRTVAEERADEQLRAAGMEDQVGTAAPAAAAPS
jgi:hypothetical protein